MTSDRRPRRRLRAALGVLALAFALVPAASQATTGWSEPTHIWITDGTVHAVASTPGAVYVGGDFSLIGPPTGSWVDLEPAGQVRSTPNILGAVVDQTVADGSGGWFM